MKRDKKEKSKNDGIAEKVLKIRKEMLSLFEDLKHDPHNPELLGLFHEKCLEFKEILKKVNQQYENLHTNQGIFQTKQ